MKRFYSVAILFALACLTAFRGMASDTFKVSSLFCDNMVLQQQTDAPVWGWDEPGAKVTVKTSWDNASYKAVAGEDGKWMVRVKTPVAGGPYSVEISGTGKVSLKDVLIGEVWVCSGQSNMEMPMRGFGFQPIDGANDAILDAPEYKDRIRIFNVVKATSDKPEPDCKGLWEKASSKAVANTSAYAYFFAERMAVGLGIPVGIIVTCWGGTYVEAWTPKDVILDAVKGKISDDVLKEKLARLDTPAAGANKMAVLYNAMINPLLPYAAKGFLWYQGCSNLNDYTHYDVMQAAMVDCWRKGWGDKDCRMPFHFVTIAPHGYGNSPACTRAYFVENQLNSLNLIPNSYATVSEIFGNEACIHPSDKKSLADQTAMTQLAVTYGLESLPVGYPKMKNFKVDGNKAIVEFENAGDGLFPFWGEAVLGFEVAGEDKVFHEAKAVVVPWQAAVEITCPEVEAPVAVRYSFHNYCKSNLVNQSGIPVPAFRTDSW